MKPLSLNTSFKHHLLVAFIIGVWLALFLVFIAPFDASDLSFWIRVRILPFYGVISFLSYLLLIPVQNAIFRAKKTWNIAMEIAFVFVYTIITLIGCYGYYKTDIINGTAQFKEFVLGIYYPISFVMLSIIILSRWFLNRKSAQLKDEKIVLKGDNKRDIIQIALADLISVSSADNYVEVHYLKEGVLHKKLLRTTLKNIQTGVSSLLQVHRSYLINPSHFKDWKNANTLHLTHMEVPVSKKYKNDVLAMVHSSQKRHDSSQSR